MRMSHPQAALDDEQSTGIAKEGFAALLAAARQAREALSTATETAVHLGKGSFPSAPEVEYSTKVSRGELQQSVAPLIER